MSDKRLSVRISPKLYNMLRKKARASGKTESEFVRAALEKAFGMKKPRTLYDVMKDIGFIGSIPDGPPDLSTNKKYMEGFGEWDNDAYRRRPAGRVGRAAGPKSSSVR
jgi:hypothetical protein